MKNEMRKQGKNAAIYTAGNDMPGLTLINKNINGVDMALVDVNTSFYLDRPVYDSDKLLKELREGFAKVWNDNSKELSTFFICEIK